jgi:hypothetical protein
MRPVSFSLPWTFIKAGASRQTAIGAASNNLSINVESRRARGKVATVLALRGSHRLAALEPYCLFYHFELAVNIIAQVHVVVNSGRESSNKVATAKNARSTA